MALYDTNNNLTSDPYSLCESMGQCLTALGGPPDFQIEPQLIDSLMELSPSIPQDAPHPEFTEIFFNTLLSNSNPVKAPGFDNTNLYLFHLAPKHIKSLLFHVCSHFITNPIPKQWLTARIFLTSGLLGLSRLTQRSSIQHHLLYHLYRRIGRPQLFQSLWISRNYLPPTQRPHYHYLPLSPQRVIPSRNLRHHHLPPLPSTHHPPPADHLRHRQLEHMPHPKYPPSLSLSPLHH